MAASSSSSSFPIPPQWVYDVFLSFRGVDTRKNFTSHLLAALERHGFNTFRDDTKLDRGEYISDTLLKAIAESRISIIVFSKNYAESRWCLEELERIMECRKTSQQIVLPIFYDVEPSDLRAHKGSVAKEFAKHEERFKGGLDGKVEKWRKALTEAANLSGWDKPKVDNGDEAKLIQKIVEEVGNRLDLAHLNVADREVGLKSRVDKLNMLLSLGSNDVRVVGMWGIGGIGKTTIAKKLYNLIHHKFEGTSFLANVRETSKQPNGLVVLQEQLLSDIFRNETHNLRNFHQGIEVIKQRALCRKVLLVLDDVDHVQQLKALAICRDYLGSGSRIIITTRDRSLLDLLEVEENEIYAPEELNKDESLELFSWHAFKKDHPIEDYVELSDQVLNYAGGLPLALEVLGSFLFRKRIPEWKLAIAKLRKIPADDIQGKLKISFDSLSKEGMDLFLDIACFFDGMDRGFTIKILEGCDCFPVIGFRVLADRCLIKYGPRNEIVMHDMLRDMGREIVRQESVKEPGKRSRLWYHEDVLEVLRDGTGTEAVEGLFLNMPEPKDVQVKNAKAFKKMNRLRLLHLNCVHLNVGYEHISRRLVWLRWNGFPLNCMPSKLSMENLVALDLCYSSLKEIWKGTVILDKLKFLYLSHCYYLNRTPDFSGLKNLEELYLNDCIRLVEVDESVRCLNKLVVLGLKNCKNLRNFPSGIWMLESLECLDLSGCSKLGKLSGFKGSPSRSDSSFLSSWTSRTKNVDSIGLSLASVQGLSCLKRLNMAHCNLSYLPSEIGWLISLDTLDLQGNNFRTFPVSLCNLTCLRGLSMNDCNVSHLPGEIGKLTSLQDLDLGGNSIHTLPASICNLTCLEQLLLNQSNLSHLPSEIGSMISLSVLDFEGNNLRTLPDSICNLTCLKSLSLTDCNMSHLPSEFGRLTSLETLSLGGNNLGSLPDSILGLTSLNTLHLTDCNVSHLPSEIGRLISLRELKLEGNNLHTLPDSICNLTSLDQLELRRCNLSHLPCEIGSLISLSTLVLQENNLCALPDSIYNLTRLLGLSMKDCNLSHLPSEIGRLSNLQSLTLEGNKLGTLPDSICNLTRLEYLQLKDCNLSDLPSEIGRLSNLRDLTLEGNNLRTLPDSFCNLTRLKRLPLTNCDVSHLPSEIGRS